MSKNITKYDNALKLMSSGEFYQFTDLVNLGVSRRVLTKLVEDGLVDNPQRGVYRSVDENTLQNNEELDFQLEMYAPIFNKISQNGDRGVLCYYSAANYHNLINDIEHTTYIAYPNERGKLKLSSDFLEVYGVRWRKKELFNVGVDKINSPHNIPMYVTSPERTVIDLFRNSPFLHSDRKRGIFVDKETVLEAIKTAKTQNVYDDEKAISIANTFNIKREYILFISNTSEYIDKTNISMRY